MTHSQIVPSVSVRPVRSALVRRLVRPAAILLIAGTLSGCSRVASAPPPDKQPVTLRFGIALPPTGSSGSGVSTFVNNLISDPIIGIGWNGKPVDRLVGEDVLWSDDGLQLSIRLAPNLKFHDGTSIDREYFRQRLESILKSPQVPGTNISYQSVTGVELDPETKDRLIIRLSRPEGFLPTDLANSTFPHPSDPNIGTGPYKVVTREPDTRLAAFDNYYRGRPKIDFVEVKSFEEQRASWAALMRGQIDAVHEISPNAIDFVQAEGQTNVHTYPFVRPYYGHLLFNIRHPLLKNPTVRQALSYAVDRQAIIDLALNRQG